MNAAPRLPNNFTKRRFKTMFTTAPHAVELSNPLVYLAALKLLARKPARPANRYAINKNGTYFHASKKFLENKIY